MPVSQNLQQITWEEWISNYWIATVSLAEATVFVRAYSLENSSPNKHKPSRAGTAKMTTAYYEGEDGYVYIDVWDGMNSEKITEPVYKITGFLADQPK